MIMMMIINEVVIVVVVVVGKVGFFLCEVAARIKYVFCVKLCHVNTQKNYLRISCALIHHNLFLSASSLHRINSKKIPF